MNTRIYTNIAVMACFFGTACAQTASAPAEIVTPASAKDGPVCAQESVPYRDLDFLVGEWEFFTMDGQKIANQTYTKREQGCLILEDWQTLFGETGTGMNFVDPFTGKWRQVWMSPSFHLDYSGGLTEPDIFVLEGRMFANDGSGSGEIRGVYSKQSDGSVTKEFLRRADSADEWQQFFIGVARPHSETAASATSDTAAADPFPDCASDSGIFDTFNFLPGHYDYLSADGTKVGETLYSARANGCVILEDFTSESGDTAIGTLMVDPATEQWTHIWRSSSFHFDMSGGQTDEGNILLEGDFHPNGGTTKQMRGIWTRQDAGKIQHSYELWNAEDAVWTPFFSGVSVPKSKP